MREENFGPVFNPDGSPTEFTLGMFGWPPRSQWTGHFGDDNAKGCNIPLHWGSNQPNPHTCDNPDCTAWIDAEHQPIIEESDWTGTDDYYTMVKEGLKDDELHNQDLLKPSAFELAEAEDNLLADAIEGNEPEAVTWKPEEMPPNYYISPFLDWIIEGWLKKFVQENAEVSHEYSEDSWVWTVNEARDLLSKLSK